MTASLLHVGETMVYSVDPLVAIGALFWFVVIVSFVWGRWGDLRIARGGSSKQE